MRHIKGKMNTLPGRLLGLAGLLIVAASPLWAAVAPAGDGGAGACAECHEELVAAFNGNPHSIIDSKGMAGHAGATFSCESCHGDLSKHLEDPSAENILGFKADEMTNEKSNRCLACHKDSRGDFLAGSHAKANMDCGQCHNIHSSHQRKQLKYSPLKTCFKCHADVFDRFKLNERHRLTEGAMACTDCHDPHKPSVRERLGGFKDAACHKCHADKQGPFLFEHTGGQVEGCAVCHDVHGSPNRHMLKDQSVAQLCYSCHTHVPGFHRRFTETSNCVTCHSTIHGSNFSPFFLK